MPANQVTYVVEETGQQYFGWVLHWSGRLVTTSSGTYEGIFSKTLDISTTGLSPDTDFTNVDYGFEQQFNWGNVPDVIHTQKGPVMSTGTTSHDYNHHHSYTIPQSGNGWTGWAYHEANSNIKHRHQIVNGVVQQGFSECWTSNLHDPLSCQSLYGVAGVGPHTHTLPSNVNPPGFSEQLPPHDSELGHEWDPGNGGGNGGGTIPDDDGSYTIPTRFGTWDEDKGPGGELIGGR